MSDLLSSLRSLLPQEYVRGQTSSCDDLEEATNYIKSLEASIKELEDKRNVLLNKSRSNKNQHGEIIGSSATSINNNTNRGVVNDNYVTIHTFPRRLEIEISVKHEGGDGFPLSKLLKQVSLVEGINVVNCLTSKGDERWKCIIHCDLVSDQPSSDFSELQRRLDSEISSYVVA